MINRNTHQVLIQATLENEFNDIKFKLKCLPSKVYNHIESASRSSAGIIICNIPWKRDNIISLPKSIESIKHTNDRMIAFGDGFIFHIDKRYSLQKTNFYFYD